MKKIIACISLVFAMSAGVTALADGATYDKDSNSVVDFNANNYSTVLITADDYDDEIVYVNQDDSGFGSAADFLLKAGTDAKDGDYTIKLGGASDGSTAIASFRISSIVPVTTPVEVMGKLVDEEKDVYSIGCKATATLNNAAYVVVTATKGSDSKTVSVPTGWTGEGTANIGIKVTNVPDDIELTVGLSNVVK